MILDCLRYWVTTYRVDGFRFDLASILGRSEDGSPMGAPPAAHQQGKGVAGHPAAEGIDGRIRCLPLHAAVPAVVVVGPVGVVPAVLFIVLLVVAESGLIWPPSWAAVRTDPPWARRPCCKAWLSTPSWGPTVL